MARILLGACWSFVRGVAARVRVGRRSGGGEVLEPAGLWLPMLAWWELGQALKWGWGKQARGGSATRGFGYSKGSWRPFTIVVSVEQVPTAPKGRKIPMLMQLMTPIR